MFSRNPNHKTKLLEKNTFVILNFPACSYVRSFLISAQHSIQIRQRCTVRVSFLVPPF